MQSYHWITLLGDGIAVYNKSLVNMFLGIENVKMFSSELLVLLFEMEDFSFQMLAAV